MILSMYALHDRVAGFYGAPFFMASDGEAIRAVSDLARDPSTSVGRHPGDFALYRLGDFDNVSGTLEPSIPTHLTNVLQLLRVQPELPLDARSPSAEEAA